MLIVSAASALEVALSAPVATITLIRIRRVCKVESSMLVAADQLNGIDLVVSPHAVVQQAHAHLLHGVVRAGELAHEPTDGVLWIGGLVQPFPDDVRSACFIEQLD